MSDLAADASADATPRQRFDELIDDGLITGWVTSVSGPNGRWEAAGGVDGISQRVETDAQFHTYCALKPLLATAIGVLVDAGELSFDDQLGHIVDARSWLGARTVADLLAHRSGVHAPSAIEMLLLSEGERLPAVLDAPPHPMAADPDTSHYSEAASWLVLASVVEALTGTDPVGFVRTHVLEPIGVAGEFDLECAGMAECTRLNVSVGTEVTRPLLIERTTALGWSANPGYGGRASMAGLAGLAGDVARSVLGEGTVLSATTAQVMTSPGPRRYDDVLDRECAFGLGWMTDLASHDFGRLSPAAFGHVGLVGMTAMWADPSTGFSGAYNLNGWSDAETLSRWARPNLVRVLRDLVV